MSKAGRNDPCPCGCGKKYKSCHSKSATEFQTSPASHYPPAPNRKIETKIFSIPATLQLAQQLYRSHRVSEAKQFLQKVLKVDTNNQDALWTLGQIHISTGNSNLAINLLHRAISNSQDAKKHFHFAQFLRIQKIFPASLLHYKKALDNAGHDLLSMRSEFLQHIVTEIRRNPANTKFHHDLIDILAPSPDRIRIEPSSACNLRCQHCPTGISYGDSSRSIMKQEVFNKLLAQLKTLPILKSCVLYLGGEPLMNKNFPAMCRQVTEEFPHIEAHFNTNGMLLDEAVSKELASAHLTFISISIDGRSAEENNSIRVGCDYQTVVKNTVMLQKYLVGTKTSIQIANTVFKRLEDPDIPVTPEFISNDLPGIHVETSYAIKWPAFDLEKSSLKKLSIGLQQSQNTCNKPITEMSVRPNGDVVLCCYDIMGQSVMGNIHQNTLLEIWHSQAYRDLRYSMLKFDINDIHQICKRCPLFSGEIPISCN